jgi:hypothetical protein
LDLSFPVFQEVDGVVTATQASVNDTTALQAPSVPVKQIGKVLPRILQYMRDTPAGLHILFSKLDLSDGFWRLIVHETDCYNFAYVLPQAAGEPTRIVVPSAVQMGWVESPSLFRPNGIYYATYGSCCCACRAGSGQVVNWALSPAGPWKRQMPHPDINCVDATAQICGEYGPSASKPHFCCCFD